MVSKRTLDADSAIERGLRRTILAWLTLVVIVATAGIAAIGVSNFQTGVDLAASIAFKLAELTSSAAPTLDLLMGATAVAVTIAVAIAVLTRWGAAAQTLPQGLVKSIDTITRALVLTLAAGFGYALLLVLAQPTLWVPYALMLMIAVAAVGVVQLATGGAKYTLVEQLDRARDSLRDGQMSADRAFGSGWTRQQTETVKGRIPGGGERALAVATLTIMMLSFQTPAVLVAATLRWMNPGDLVAFIVMLTLPGMLMLVARVQGFDRATTRGVNNTAIWSMGAVGASLAIGISFVLATSGEALHLLAAWALVGYTTTAVVLFVPQVLPSRPLLRLLDIESTRQSLQYREEWVRRAEAAYLAGGGAVAALRVRLARRPSAIRWPAAE